MRCLANVRVRVCVQSKENKLNDRKKSKCSFFVINSKTKKHFGPIGKFIREQSNAMVANETFIAFVPRFLCFFLI